jgi:chromosome segregation ATPase
VDEEPTLDQPPIAFDKMRAMLGRASEVRAQEQQQVVDLIDEVRSRLAPIEGIVTESQGRLATTHDNVTSIQDRLGKLPDRNEVSVIAERLDEALTRIDAQDEALKQVNTAMTSLGERIGRPLDALEARLEGVAGRFEGVSGRLDGVDDRMQHLHARLDELDDTIERVQGAVDSLPGRLDLPAVHRRFDELSGAIHQRLDDDLGHVHGRLDELLARPAVDPSERLDGLTAKLEQVVERVEAVAGKVRGVDDAVRNNAGTLAGSLEQGIDKLHGALHARPDRDEFSRTLRKAQHESERRITQQLDSVLADFAEVVISQNVSPKASRSAQRKPPKKPAEAEETSGD